MRVVAASVGAMIQEGPISQPTRHPVAANASKMPAFELDQVRGANHGYLLPAEYTVTVRSHIPGRVAILTCSFPSYTRQSYWKTIMSRLPYFSYHHWPTYHFVGHHHKIMFFGKLCDGLDFNAIEYLAHGIVRSVDDNHLRSRSNRSSRLKPISRLKSQSGAGTDKPQFFEVNLPVIASGG